ncbi:serine/threonine-protein kinase [Dokdonella fugitiva]|uniref:serine/threonine-protein kinase n=1 Tax=Dokdonella fugitiva TaxID=328517 RepID=UPI0015F8CE77|nr:serine/threonine-protein kinase [Dokdonella fugitiva]MBA8884657.1 hypothetical protein [Dokdonella fugitiva]
MARTDPSIERLLERILEAAPADDALLDAASGVDARQAEALRTLSDIARAFRDFDTAPRAPALFTWGPLAVQEKIADGAASEVFRAFDPGLGLPVALKLLRAGDGAPRARTFLDEARCLARVRHRNVVRVFGAAVHDGRAGLWCEWIEGRSLAAWIVADGPLGAEETIVVGRALCRALGAVHAAGLLHGDVKPDNVLRERGGRIVLADLGAGGEPAHVNALLRSTATPAFLAPEVLAGALRTPAHDLYALGGLLQFLLDGRVPGPDRSDPPARHDVPAALRAVIARARDADPTRRFADAAAMEQALADALPGHAQAPAAPRAGRRGLAIAASVAVLALVVAGSIALRPASGPPQAEVELLLQHDAAIAPAADGTQVALGDRLAFSVTSREPVWLYAFNADDAGVLTRLFPLPGLDTTNPLQAGRHEIPGRARGRNLRFEVSSSAAAEEFLLVAATAPLARLDAFDAADGRVDADVRTRSVGRAVPATTGATDARLDALAAELAADRRVRTWRYRLPHRD